MNKLFQTDKDKVLDTLISIVYPRRCPVCDDIVTPFGDKIHKDCKNMIQVITEPACFKCGKPLGRNGEMQEFCDDCRRIKHFYDKGRAAVFYRSISSSIYRFKYAGRAEYADGYGEIVSDSLGSWIRSLKADALIPVPMYKKKERLRGYNQASVLAKAIGKELNIPVRDDLILRTRNTVPMKKLDEKGRRINLKKAFKVTSNDVKLKSIIIIDDIYTTGSTIDEIAHEFRQVGVERIYFCTLAIGQTI